MSISKENSRWIQFLVLVCVAMLLTWLAFRGQDLHLIWAKIVEANWGWVMLSLLLTLLGHVSRARRWQLLIQGTGHQVRLIDCWVAMMTGYLSNLGIPRIGELGRCASLARLSNVPMMALGGTVVVERVVDVLTLAVLALITFLAAGERVLKFWATEIAGPLQSIWGWKLGLLLLAGLLMLAIVAWFAMGRPKQGQASILGRIRGWAADLWAGMWSAAKMPRKASFFLHTLLIWLSYYSAPLCMVLALGIGGDDLFSLAFYAFVFGSMARTIPLPAGSMGAYHYLISQLLVALGYSYLEGISLATLNHGVQTLFYLVFGLVGVVVFVVLSRRRVVKE